MVTLPKDVTASAAARLLFKVTTAIWRPFSGACDCRQFSLSGMDEDQQPKIPQEHFHEFLHYMKTNSTIVTPPPQFVSTAFNGHNNYSLLCFTVHIMWRTSYRTDRKSILHNISVQIKTQAVHTSVDNRYWPASNTYKTKFCYCSSEFNSDVLMFLWYSDNGPTMTPEITHWLWRSPNRRQSYLVF